MKTLALVIAHVLFRLRAALRPLLSFGGGILGGLFVAFLSRRGVSPPAIEPMASYISANGTTAASFSAGGPAATGAFAGTSLDTPPGGSLALGTANASNVNIGSGAGRINIGVPGGPFIGVGYQSNPPSIILSALLTNLANINVANLTQISISGTQSGLAFDSNGLASLACGTGTTIDVGGLPNAPYVGYIVTTGTLTSNCILDFSNVMINSPQGPTQGQYAPLDMSAVTLGAAFGVEFKNGTATKTYLSTSGVHNTMATAWTYGANTLAVNW